MSKYQPALAKQQLASALQALLCARNALENAAEHIEESYPHAAGRLRDRVGETARLRREIREQIEGSALPTEARP